MSTEQNKRLQEAVNSMIVSRLQAFRNKDLNKQTCIEVYLSLFEAISELVQIVPVFKSKLDERAVNYVAQAFYDMVDVNGQDLDPNVFDKRVNVSDLPSDQLALVSPLFVGTPIYAEIVATLKKRS